MRLPENNLPVLVTVGESVYEPDASQHVAFYDSGRWYYQDTAEHFKAPVVQWRDLKQEEEWRWN